MATIGGPSSPSDRPCVRLKKSGIQNRYSHQTGSVMNFPSANAHVCRLLSTVVHGTGAVGSTGSLVICASSVRDTAGCRAGVSYISHHAISHAIPSAPVATNAQYQPYRTVIHGTTNGVTSAPTFVPALKIPV